MSVPTPLFKMFISTDIPIPHPADDSRDVLNVTDSKTLLNTSMESGKLPFWVVGRPICYHIKNMFNTVF